MFGDKMKTKKIITKEIELNVDMCICDFCLKEEESSSFYIPKGWLILSKQIGDNVTDYDTGEYCSEACVRSALNTSF